MTFDISYGAAGAFIINDTYAKRYANEVTIKDAPDFTQRYAISSRTYFVSSQAAMLMLYCCSLFGDNASMNARRENAFLYYIIYASLPRRQPRRRIYRRSPSRAHFGIVKIRKARALHNADMILILIYCFSMTVKHDDVTARFMVTMSILAI